jgi:predicted MFS family arabinose efflux permease
VRNPFASRLWRNPAFRRFWAAATVSIFGSLITRIALPLVAILTLDAGPIEVAALRGTELAALMVIGLAAGTWVDRLRRRPILIWADLGRAVLLGSIPVAFVLGALTLWHLLIVSALAAALTAFFDAADNAYLPTIVERKDLVEANSALAASGSAAEFAGFGLSGFLVSLLTGPITILIDAVTYVISAGLLLTVRTTEPEPPQRSERAPFLDEVREGLRLVRHDPILRAFAGSQMVVASLWGIFGAVWTLFVIDELGIGPAAIGVIAAIGGASSFIGALVASRSTRRWGIGPVAVVAMLMAALGNLLVPLAPAGLPLVALGFLVAQQLISDSAMTVYDITDVSVRQSLVDDRALGRVTATFDVLSVAAQLIATIAAGFVAVAIGLRPTAFLAPIGGVLAALILWRSPVWRLGDLPLRDARTAAQVVVDVERDQPLGA